MRCLVEDEPAEDGQRPEDPAGVGVVGHGCERSRSPDSVFTITGRGVQLHRNAHQSPMFFIALPPHSNHLSQASEYASGVGRSPTTSLPYSGSSPL